MMVLGRSGGVRAMATAACVVAIATTLPATAAGVPASPGEVASVPVGVGALSLIPWHTSPSLLALRREIDTRWPGRSRISDGVIGDRSHSRSTNSHNPVGASNGPRFGTRGAVHAMDITASGIDVQRVLNAVIGDSRVWYVIHGGKIWSRTYGWAARTQSGDPHNTHIHINLREDSPSAATTAERDTRSWFTGSTAAAPAYLARPASATSLTTAQVRTLQQKLIARGFAIPAGPTGYYGAQTAGAVAAFQRSQGWSGSEADGAVGPGTLKRLGLSFGASPAKTVSTAPAKASAPKSARTSQVTPPSTRLLSKKKTRKLQRALISRGFTIPSGPTGKYGVETTRAVAAYQRSQGWSGGNADGIAGATTLRRLGVKPPKSAPRAAKVRTPAKSTTSSSRKSTTKWDPSTAILVYNLQGALISRGYSIPAGQTGYFGPRTQKAVKAFQRAQGWRGSQADGIPGSGTLKRLGL